MSIEGQDEIIRKVSLAKWEFKDPRSLCVAVALDGIAGGKLPYEFWKVVAATGATGGATYRVFSQVIVPFLGTEQQVERCDGDSIKDRRLFSQDLVQKVRVNPCSLLIGTSGRDCGHALSLVTDPSGRTIEYNGLLPNYAAVASTERVQEIIRRAFRASPCYFFGLGVQINPEQKDV